MATFDVSEIVSHLNKNYITKASFYEVTIAGNSKVIDAPKDVMFNCSSVNIPGINLGTHYDVRHGIGIGTNYPNAKAFSDIEMTFYETEYAKERKYFSNWIDSIYNKDTHKFGFYKDYVKDITITQYNRQGKQCYQVKLIQAYPTNISQLSRGYALDGVPQFAVNFTFYNMKETFYLQTQEDNSNVGLFGMLRNLF
jgi:hypothetical protein